MGDLVKALAAGASAVMMGSLFAGCEGAPGSPVIHDGQKVKVVHGMASLGAAIGRRAAEQTTRAPKIKRLGQGRARGRRGGHPLHGNIAQSSTSWSAACMGPEPGRRPRDPEVQANAEFVGSTAAGVRESHSHDVREIALYAGTASKNAQRRAWRTIS